MTKATKETLKSIIVLFVIALVCVALLSVANEFLKYEAKLDAAMAKKLYEVCPTGEADDSKAIEYFEIVEATEEIEQINDKFGSADTFIVAVYRQTKGSNEGCYIVQASAQGRDSAVVMLTSFDKSAKIMKTINYSQTESYWAKVDTAWFDNVSGKDGNIKPTDFAASSGATISLTAVSNAINLSAVMAQELLKSTDSGITQKLQEVLPATSYEQVFAADIIGEINAAAPDEFTKVLEVYVANTGEYIILAQSKTNQWYPPLTMLTAYDKSGKIIKTTHYTCEDGYFEKVNTAWYDNLSGKNGTIASTDFASNTGATITLDSMARAITISNKAIVELLKAPLGDMLVKLTELLPSATKFTAVEGVDEMITSVNASAPDEYTKVLNAYEANTGEYIILSQSKTNQWYPPLQMLTAYGADGKIIKTTHYFCQDGYFEKVNTQWYNNLSGKDGTIASTDFASNTGATITLDSMARAITIANQLAAKMTAVPLKLLPYLNQVLPADSYQTVKTADDKIAQVNASAPDADTKVLAVYKANNGQYIILSQSKNGQWYPPLQMLTAYGADGKIVKTTHYFCEDAYFNKVNTAWYDNVSGKNGTVAGSDFATDTGATATLDTMGKAITVANNLAQILTGGGV